MSSADARAQFEKFRDDPGPLDTARLDAYFDTLEPISCEQLFGAWKGGELKTGHKGSLALKALQWHGKTFHSRLDVKPLMCRNDEGQLYSNQAMKGEASLWMIEFRGKTSACMVYDGQPVFDHFRKIDDHTVMGIMDGKEQVFDNGKHFYFYLERE
ncbi:MAG: DUF4334 domain-containing protein [Pirellulales bacterium]|nr:DUF4334 domain-containing protein [Pirellulales bacterium]